MTFVGVIPCKEDHMLLSCNPLIARKRVRVTFNGLDDVFIGCYSHLWAMGVNVPG